MKGDQKDQDVNRAGFCQCGCNRPRVMLRRVGRPRSHPMVRFPWQYIEGIAKLKLTPQELECLRLVDHEDLTQIQAADQMGVSRATIWRILQSARKKIIDVLLNASDISVDISNNN